MVYRVGGCLVARDARKAEVRPQRIRADAAVCNPNVCDRLVLVDGADQVRALGTNVSGLENQIPGKLWLQVEGPLLQRGHSPRRVFGREIAGEDAARALGGVREG